MSSGEQQGAVGERLEPIKLRALSARSSLGDGSGSAEQQGARDKHPPAKNASPQLSGRGDFATAGSTAQTHARGGLDGVRPVNAEGRPNPPAVELPESVERVVQTAAMQKKADSNHMQVLLRDSHLGRLAVRLVERAGLIDTLVRTDSTRAGALISENLPSLFETLAQRGLQVSQGSHTAWGGAQEDAPGQRGGRQRSPRAPQRGGSNRGKTAREFRVQVEQIQ